MLRLKQYEEFEGSVGVFSCILYSFISKNGRGVKFI